MKVTERDAFFTLKYIVKHRCRYFAVPSAHVISGASPLTIENLPLSLVSELLTYLPLGSMIVTSFINRYFRSDELWHSVRNKIESRDVEFNGYQIDSTQLEYIVQTAMKTCPNISHNLLVRAAETTSEIRLAEFRLSLCAASGLVNKHVEEISDLITSNKYELKEILETLLDVVGQLTQKLHLTPFQTMLSRISNTDYVSLQVPMPTDCRLFQEIVQMSPSSILDKETIAIKCYRWSQCIMPELDVCEVLAYDRSGLSVCFPIIKKGETLYMSPLYFFPRFTKFTIDEIVFEHRVDKYLCDTNLTKYFHGAFHALIVLPPLSPIVAGTICNVIKMLLCLCQGGWRSHVIFSKEEICNHHIKQLVDSGKKRLPNVGIFEHQAEWRGKPRGIHGIQITKDLKKNRVIARGYIERTTPGLVLSYSYQQTFLDRFTFIIDDCRFKLALRNLVKTGIIF
eukprot:GILJ01011991.1.p1 GENE.GILJ01011991.1~~GILJ01011991.1.p1  ORF type:complete len:454 (+),score=37.05 GILJ01011991.1:117-1478(+)